MITPPGFASSLEFEMGLAAGVFFASLWPFVQKIGRNHLLCVCQDVRTPALLNPRF
jgi:hypothetical protein